LLEREYYVYSANCNRHTRREEGSC